MLLTDMFNELLLIHCGLQPGETAEICVPLSNPNMPDSDEDGFMDYEDARPNVVNPDMIYYFANPDFYYLGSSRANMYRQMGLGDLSNEKNINEFFDYLFHVSDILQSGRCNK